MENENPTLKRKIEEDDKPDVVIKKLKTIEKPIIDINLPNGLIYLDNFISEEEEIDLLKHIDNGKWLNDLSLGSNCVMDFKNIVTKETKGKFIYIELSKKSNTFKKSNPFEKKSTFGNERSIEIQMDAFYLPKEVR